MSDASESHHVPDVRELARQGRLAGHVQSVSDDERRVLRTDAYGLIWPIVFRQLTRRLELGKGHYRCASSVHRLEPECLDRFQDDVEAAVDDLFHRARSPIASLEGWVSRRLNASTVDAHRRRRGARGALQRPRVPRWLATALGDEPRLTALAVEMLVWVGVETTAGLSVWPLAVWAERRAVAGPDRDNAEKSVAGDVETVLAAMRRRPEWYSKYVERPLGRKQAPLIGVFQIGPDAESEPSYLATTEPDAASDARLLELANAAIEAIVVRLARGEDPRLVVVDVLTTAFGPSAEAEDLGSYPGHDPDVHHVVTTALADAAAIDRIVAVVLDLLPPPALD